MAVSTETSNFAAQDDLSHVSATGLWSSMAPAAIRRAHRSGDHEKQWTAWQRHLATRRRPKALDKLLPGGSTPLAWALPHRLRATTTAELIERLGSLRRKDASTVTKQGDLEDEGVG